MVTIALVAVGGAVGAVSRYLINVWVAKFNTGFSLPIGPVAVNLAGCFAIGLLLGLDETHKFLSPHSRGFLVVGILGGFTTFSAFGNDTFILFQNGQVGWALLNVGLQVVIGILAVGAGYGCAKAF